MQITRYILDILGTGYLFAISWVFPGQVLNIILVIN